MSSFEALSISAPILRALETLSFDKPTEIQTAAIPILMKGEDLIGVAQTGGGKTAAFVIPMLERLAGHADKPKPGMPRALILAPTRELAIQITDKIKELSTGMSSRVCTVYGGVPYRTQIHILRRGVDIIVATPGRLKDHMKQGNIYLDETEYFVLDEADRMLDMGFVDEVRDIAKKLPAGHQSVMFSATMNAKITKLTDTLLHNAIRVEVARQATVADNLEHKIMFVPGHKKNDLLLQLIEDEKPTKALIFVRTRRDADHLCEYLDAVGFKTEAIHGDKKQKYRQRTINNFKIGRFDYLVATDVAARGIDVQDISHVFNMDVPVEAESYVHRIGRTARAGAHGRAITLCGKAELNLLRDIEHLIKMKINVDNNHPFPLTIGKPKFSKRPDQSQRTNGHKPWEKRANKRSNTVGGDRTEGRYSKSGDGKPWQKREDRHSDRPASDKPWQNRDDKRSDRPAGDKPWQNRDDKRSDRPAGDKPWQNRDDKRSDRPAGDKPWQKREDRHSDRPAGDKPWQKRDDKRSDRPTGDKPWQNRSEGRNTRTDDSKPSIKREEAHTEPRSEKSAEKKQWSQPAETRADKPSSKKAKRVDASANKRKSKAGAKKRPSVIARKAKIAQTKAFRKPSAQRGNTPAGGDQPLRRRG